MEVATLFCFCFIITFQLTFQNLLTRNEIGLPNLIDYEYADNDHRINRHHQAIIPTYRFNCCGNITVWGVDVFYNDQNSYTLDLQVWRPSPTVNNSTGTGCYSLVGNNRFTSISLSGGVAVVTPSPQDYIQFQPGDVLGFYVEKANENHHGIVLRTIPSWLTSELVWFASLNPEATTSQTGDCPYSVGSTGVLNRLTRAAPVISISITSVPCSLSPAVTTQNSEEFVFTPIHTSSIPSPTSSNNIRILESTLLFLFGSMSHHACTPKISKSTTTETNTAIVKSPLSKDKITLIVATTITVAVLILIIIVIFVIIIMLRRKKSGKGKQQEPGESVVQQGISNQTYFDTESQTKTSEAGIEIVPACNGESVIYHCIGPSTSHKTDSDCEQPEAHHYFELESLPTHHTYQYTDISQISLGRAKDQTAAKLGKSVPIYEDIICSQQFQDPKESEFESDCREHVTNDAEHQCKLTGVEK